MGHRRGNRHRTWRSRTDRQTDSRASACKEGSLQEGCLLQPPQEDMAFMGSVDKAVSSVLSHSCYNEEDVLWWGEQAGKIPQPRGQCPGWLEKTSQAGKGACMIGRDCQGLLHDCAQEYGMNRSTGESVRGGSSLWIYAKVDPPGNPLSQSTNSCLPVSRVVNRSTDSMRIMTTEAETVTLLVALICFNTKFQKVSKK